jgi:P-type E1-E2 ATPase
MVANILIGFFQEFKSDKTMASLRKLASPTAKITRNGQVTEIAASNIVPGDIVLLDAGDVVGADMRLIETINLKVDEAMLTGESEPVEKYVDPIEGDTIPLGDRKNMAYMSTIVTQGRSKGIVTATGMNTQIGCIAKAVTTKGFANLILWPTSCSVVLVSWP